MHHNEVAWLSALGAFAAATRYILRKRTLDLMLCALFVMLVCLVLSIKEMVGCFVGLLIIFLPNRAGFGSLGVGLAMLAGVAHDTGLLPNLDEPISVKVQGIGFESPHNQPITWMQLLQQTSEWEGDCFGVPDQVDRYRHLQ